MKNQRERNLVSQGTNMFYYISKKSRSCLCDSTSCFLSVVNKNKPKQI